MRFCRTPPRVGPRAELCHQSRDFLSGNEAAARAARDVGFHVMGYFPITPSTEVAETLSKMQANGEHDIVMIPADGEHGAAGICYGAALGGGRVLNATSSQGLLYRIGTTSRAVINPRPDGAQRGHAGDFRTAGYPLRPFRYLLCAEHRLDHPDGEGSTGRLRHEPCCDPHRRARRCPAAGPGRLRRVLHQPPEAQGGSASTTRKRCRNSWALRRLLSPPWIRGIRLRLVLI